MNQFIEMLTGWMAYQLMSHSTVSLVFISVLAFLVVLLVWMQFRTDTFDIRDIVCELKDGKQIISTNKSLLTGAFLISSYGLVEHWSEGALGIYMTAWVANGGITAWQKVQVSK